MKQLSLKAFLSSLLLVFLVFLGVSGMMLYYGKTGLILGFARHGVRQAHFYAGAMLCLLALLHVYLNRRFYAGELRALSGKGK
jgi:cytochrome b subunit of formate dehydrogenase